MLILTIEPEEFWDEANLRFIYTQGATLRLEHSLVSLSKWESKWCKPFLVNSPKTTEETIDYIKCMTLNKNVDPEIYNHISDKNILEINDYIGAKMTATTFSEIEQHSGGFRGEVITSELIYYWMIALNIPFECEKWHLNRLITLVQVCNIKNSPPKKMGRDALLARNRALNEARRKKLKTRG